MSLYINVEKSDLKIKRGNFKNIIYAFQELAEKNDNFEKLKGVKTIKDILDFIGIPYEYDELVVRQNDKIICGVDISPFSPNEIGILVDE